jgi:hypothetical protein
MRSDIVFEALDTQNAFELCHRAFKLIRKSHKPNTRIQDTTNAALRSIAEAQPVSEGEPLAPAASVPEV